MTHQEMIDLFNKHEDKYSVDGLNKVRTQRSLRRDLHVLIELDRIIGDTRDTRNIIRNANHEKLTLCYHEALPDRITEEDIIDLCKCGVFVLEDSLVMYC